MDSGTAKVAKSVVDSKTASAMSEPPGEAAETDSVDDVGKSVDDMAKIERKKYAARVGVEVRRRGSRGEKEPLSASG